MLRFSSRVASKLPPCLPRTVAPLASAGVRPALSASASTSERLAALQQQLKDDAGPALVDFAGADDGRDPEEARKNLKRKDPPKPKWLRISTPSGATRKNYERLLSDVRDLNLSTVCEEAACPNIGECWGGGKDVATATVMLGGEVCTRACKFCAVKTSATPPPLDPNEPQHVGQAVGRWGLGYVVLTSVDRDDMADHGADHIARTVEAIKASAPDTLVEVLTPDFGGQQDRVERVVASGLDVFAHNLETVEEVTPRVRDRRAGYRQSLRTLELAKEARPSIVTKTSLMLGVGETVDQIRQTMQDCRDSDVDVITFGQYLRPSKRHLPVDRWVHPDEFDMWRAEAEALGFAYVASGPLVRSSYKAGEFFLESMLRERAAAAAVAAGE